MSQAKKRVLIVDDHPMVRAGIRATLEQHGSFVVSGEIGTASELLARVEESNTDVVLLDLALQRYDGILLIKEIRDRRISLPILVHSMHDEEIYAARALKAGANGYVMKDVNPDDVIEALLAVLAGKTALSSRMRARLDADAFEAARQPDSISARLSDRELHVFRLIGAGLSTREIATELGISPKTVENHREHIKEKLGFRDGKELVEAAHKWVDRIDGK